MKTCNISESAFSEKGTRRRKKTVKIIEGGFVNPVSNPVSNPASNPASNAASADSSNWLRYPQGPVPPKVNEAYTGGKHDKEKEKEKDTEKQVKVELKKKITFKKVHLNPKTKPKINSKKIKKSRKFVLGLSTFHKRITRAKKACKKINELPLDKLKEKLIKDGLIKSTSKAPESVLRQIANDAAIVNKRAL